MHIEYHNEPCRITLKDHNNTILGSAEEQVMSVKKVNVLIKEHGLHSIGMNNPSPDWAVNTLGKTSHFFNVLIDNEEPRPFEKMTFSFVKGFYLQFEVYPKKRHGLSVLIDDKSKQFSLHVSSFNNYESLTHGMSQEYLQNIKHIKCLYELLRESFPQLKGLDYINGISQLCSFNIQDIRENIIVLHVLPINDWKQRLEDVVHHGKLLNSFEEFKELLI